MEKPGSAPQNNTQAKIVCVFGRRGSGKSTLARTLVIPDRRLIVFNTLGETEHNMLGHVCRTRQELFDYVENRPVFRAVADFRDDDTLGWTVKLCEAMQNCTLLVDELDRFCSPTSVLPEIDACCRYGRHSGVSLMVCSRRPAEIPRIVTSQAHTIHVFRITEPRDVAYLKAYLGDTRFSSLAAHAHLSYDI